MENIRIAPRALAGRQRLIRSAFLVVHHVEEGYRNQYEKGGREREQKKKSGSVAWECKARYDGIEESAQSESSQWKCRCRPAVCWPVEGRCGRQHMQLHWFNRLTSFQGSLKCSATANACNERKERYERNAHGTHAALVRYPGSDWQYSCIVNDLPTRIG